MNAERVDRYVTIRPKKKPNPEPVLVTSTSNVRKSSGAGRVKRPAPYDYNSRFQRLLKKFKVVQEELIKCRSRCDELENQNQELLRAIGHLEAKNADNNNNEDDVPEVRAKKRARKKPEKRWCDACQKFVSNWTRHKRTGIHQSNVQHV